MEIDIAGIGLRLAALVFLVICLYLTVRALLIELRRDDDPPGGESSGSSVSSHSP